MDNKRIATGYDVELQLMPEKVKGIIDSILDDVLPSIKKEIGFDVPINIVGGQFKSDDGHATFAYPNQQSSDEEQSPILQITFSCEEADDGSRYIKPLLMVNILGSFIDITTLSDKIIIPSFSLPSGITEAEIIAVPASDGYTHAIVLLANIDFAKLLDIETEITRSDITCDKSKAQSFLPIGESFIIGLNKTIYNSLSIASFLLAGKEISEDNDIPKEVKIKKAYTSISEDTLNIIVSGICDVPNTDELDLSFKINTSIKFSMGEDGLLQAQCDVDTEFNKNAWYTVLGTILGTLVLGPAGGIVGLHTNSIIKRATRKIRAKMSEKVKAKLHSTVDYYYCSDNGVGKLRQTKCLVNQINCFFRKPIAVMQRSNAYFYTTNYAAKLNATSTFFDDNGATIWGNLIIVGNYPICNDVTLKRIKYYKNGIIPALVYEDIHNNKQAELSLEIVLATSETTERIASESFDSKTDNSRKVAGNLPMSFLNFPIAVQKINNELAAFKFDNGMIAKKEELIKLYKNGMILIKDVKLVGSEGNEYFISMRDKTKENNLSSLPSISKEDMESIYIGE